MINLLLQELRMSQLRSQVSIVGEEKHTSSVAVQTTYRIDALTTAVLHKLHYSLALLWVIRSGHIILRFVKNHIHLLLDAHELVVEVYLICTLNLRAQLCHYGTVHRNHTSLDELVCLTSRTNTCVGQELVQTDWSIRIFKVFLILNLLLHAILSIRVVVGCALTVVATTLLIAVAITIAIATTALLMAITVVVVATSLLIATTVVVVATLTIIATALLIATLLLKAAFLLLIVLLIATMIVATFTLLIATITLLVATTVVVATTVIIAALTVIIAALTVITSIVIVSTLLITALTWLILALFA